MAWTINNGKLYFNSVLYTGNAGTNAITGVGFQPDWVWLKQRSGSASSHKLYDAVRETTKYIASNNTGAEGTESGVTAFGTDGFTLGSAGGTNGNSETYASWNWIAAGTAPSNTYAVKVVSDGGNKYRFDDFGTSAVTLEISEGGTFTFDQADSSNSGHPIRFSTTSDGSHGGGSEYTTGVTTNGTPGNAGAYTRITVAASAPTLYYYCTAHSGMGGQANTPTTNSFSNFAGTIQSNISPNTTSGFSIVSYTGNGTNPSTVGHGLGSVPKMIITKPRSSTGAWHSYHVAIGNGAEIYLDKTNAKSNNSTWNSTTPTSSVFTIGNSDVNTNNTTMIAYCFAEKQGYSKFGSYTGNGNADGVFIYTGFKPAWTLIKRTDSSTGGSWILFDNKRGNNVINPVDVVMAASNNQSESDWGTTYDCDYLSNGFKWRFDGSGGYNNTSGATYIYMAFAENPFTSSAGTPVTAR